MKENYDLSQKQPFSELPIICRPKHFKLNQGAALQWFKMQSGKGLLAHKYFGHYYYIRLSVENIVLIYLHENFSIENITEFIKHDYISTKVKHEVKALREIGNKLTIWIKESERLFSEGKLTRVTIENIRSRYGHEIINIEKEISRSIEKLPVTF